MHDLPPELRSHRTLRTVRAISRRISNRFGIYGHAEWLRRWSARRWREETLLADFDDTLWFWCDLAEHHGSRVFWRGGHSPDQLRFLDTFLTPDMTFLDVGANHGVLTVFAAKRLPRGRVIAIEPVSATADILERNIATNRFTNCSVFRLALGAQRRTAPIFGLRATFIDGTINSGLASLFCGEDRPDELGMTEVIRLDDLRQELDLSRLDVVKIDVEGAEPDVLSGGQSTIARYRPLLLIEILDHNCRLGGRSEAELLSVIRSMDYELFPLLATGEVVPFERVSET